MPEQSHMKLTQLYGHFVTGWLVRFGGVLCEPTEPLNAPKTEVESNSTTIIREIRLASRKVVIVSNQEDYISYPIQVYTDNRIRYLLDQIALSRFLDEITLEHLNANATSEDSIV